MNKAKPDGAIVRDSGAPTMADLAAAVEKVKDILSRMPRAPGQMPEDISAESFQAAWLTQRVWDLTQERDRAHAQLDLELSEHRRTRTELGDEQRSHADTAGALQLQSREVIRLQDVMRNARSWRRRWFG